MQTQKDDDFAGGHTHTKKGRGESANRTSGEKYSGQTEKKEGGRPIRDGGKNASGKGGEAACHGGVGAGALAAVDEVVPGAVDALPSPTSCTLETLRMLI